MIPMDDWMVLDKEELKKETKLIIPENAIEPTTIECGDIFIPTKLGPQAVGRISIGERLLFYGVATVMGIKLPSGKKVWLGKAADVAFKLEKGE